MKPTRKERYALRVLATAALVPVIFFSTRAIIFATHFPPGPDLWAMAPPVTTISHYDIAADTVVGNCGPSPSGSGGQGIAYDPVDGNLWYTIFIPDGLKDIGDGYIHKATPTCGSAPGLTFADGPGGPIPDDLGALDVDPDDFNIWAAGYFQSNIYKVDRTTGAIIQSCSVAAINGPNQTLAVAKLRGLSGSGKYLLTAGDYITVGSGAFVPTVLLAIDVAACTGGAPVSAVTTYSLPAGSGVGGIDYEAGKLIAEDWLNNRIYNLGGAPFSTIEATMPDSSTGNRDITLQVGVNINIKPGSDPNSFNCARNGNLAVAVLGSAAFDATQVVATSVTLVGPFGSVSTLGKSQIEDVNSDGFPDVVLFFANSGISTAIGCPLPKKADVTVTVVGETVGGRSFAGSDVLTIANK